MVKVEEHSHLGVILDRNNLCQKSWNTYVISGDHLVVSPLPLKTMLMYTVLTGTETVEMLVDTSLTNKHLIQHCF